MSRRNVIAETFMAGGMVLGVGGLASEYVHCDGDILLTRDEIMVPFCADGERFPEDSESRLAALGLAMVLAGRILHEDEHPDDNNQPPEPAEI